MTYQASDLDRAVTMGEGGGHLMRGGSGEGQFHLDCYYTAHQIVPGRLLVMPSVK